MEPVGWSGRSGNAAASAIRASSSIEMPARRTSRVIDKPLGRPITADDEFVYWSN
jgi:hypothetical protein